MVNQTGEKLCALLNGCGDLAQRLPGRTDIFLFVVAGGVMVWLLSALHGWRPVVFSAVLVGLTDFILFVRLDAAQWQQGDAAVATLFSGFCVIITLAFERMFVSISPHVRYGLRLFTPMLSVCITLVLWLQAGVRG